MAVSTRVRRWFYFLLFLVSIVFSVITQDVLRIFGDRLSASVHWFDGWRGLVRLHLLVSAVLLPALWLVLLLLDGPGPLIQNRDYANGILMGNLRILLIIALALTGYVSRQLGDP